MTIGPACCGSDVPNVSYASSSRSSKPASSNWPPATSRADFVDRRAATEPPCRDAARWPAAPET